MTLPKFSELSASVQILTILLLGAALWAGSEFVYLKPVSDGIVQKQAQADQLAKELAPLRQYEQKQRTLIADNAALEMKLTMLRQIVPNEKEVDNFIRLVEAASVASGVDVRRFTSKPAVTQDYYVEVPFEMEIDGPYYQILGFFDRLSKVERIVNVSDMKMGSIREGKSVGNKTYAYNPNETVVAVCTITTFFSREEQAPAPVKPSQAAAKPPQKK